MTDAVTALPAKPLRSLGQALFVTRWEAWLSQFTDLTVDEINAAVGTVNAASLLALAAVAPLPWVSGTTYAIGDPRYDPTNFQAYRRRTVGAGTTAPNADPTNWQQLDTLPSKTGNALKVLRVNAGETSTEWAADNNSMVLLATLTPTAAANLDALSVFTADYDNYVVIGNDVRTDTNTAYLCMRLANAGTVDATTAYGMGDTTAITQSFFNLVNNQWGGAPGANFIARISNVNSTGLKSITTEYSAAYSATPTYTNNVQRGFYTRALAASGVRLYFTGGNFQAAGSIRIFGIKNT